jgi:hypothetical protein
MPIVHMNGTSALTLLEDNSNANLALYDAEEIIRSMEFHSRDYYPVAGAWEQAVAERDVHLKAIRAAREYFSAISEHVSNI